MKNKKAFIRRDLVDFTPYKAGDVTHAIKLDANENPYKMDSEVQDEIVKWLEEQDGFSVYPDSDSKALRDAIAEFYKVSKNQVICGVGSDQLIDCLIRGVMMPGDSVVYPNPSFSMYQSVITLNHGKGIPVDLDEDFSYNIEEMIKVCNKNQAKLLILCTPNNPTGNSLSLDEIKEIASRVQCLVMVDEAYGEFTQNSAIPLIDEFENIVVLRTFSKAYGLAGLRIGYGIGSETALYPIEITKPPYNINRFSQFVAQKVIENSEPYRHHVEEIKRNRKILHQGLLELGIIVYPSDANFLLVDCKNIALDEILKGRNIYIRKMTIRNQRMYRISIGSKEENQLLLKSVQEAWQDGAKKQCKQNHL